VYVLLLFTSCLCLPAGITAQRSSEHDSHANILYPATRSIDFYSFRSRVRRAPTLPRSSPTCTTPGSWRGSLGEARRGGPGAGRGRRRRPVKVEPPHGVKVIFCSAFLRWC